MYTIASKINDTPPKDIYSPISKLHSIYGNLTPLGGGTIYFAGNMVRVFHSQQTFRYNNYETSWTWIFVNTLNWNKLEKLLIFFKLNKM